MSTDGLIGVGLYTPAEAGRLLRIPAAKISRWLRGHHIQDKFYPPLWSSEISLGDDRILLGFRDLMEVRVADAFIRAGVSAIRVRAAIEVAKDVIGQDWPLSTNRFRTDGREIFLHIVEEDEDGEKREHLLNLFRRQFEFNDILDPILKTVDFNEDGQPELWWPGGRAAQRRYRSCSLVRSADRSLIKRADNSVSCRRQAGRGVRNAARAYDVSEAAVRHAVEFETMMEQRLAA